MKFKKYCKKLTASVLSLSLVLTPYSEVSATTENTPVIADSNSVTRALEKTDRGLVAISTDTGVFLSWRLYGTEVTGANNSNTGLNGTNFNIYRDGELIKSCIEDSTNYLDEYGNISSTYEVRALADDNVTEIDTSSTVTVLENNYIEIPISQPDAGGTQLDPTSALSTYYANDTSVGDLDGDGEYEYIVKWYPSNAKDNSQGGYTSPTILDAYELDGTLMWRINIGYNLRSGAHYLQFMVYDFDGDGKAEVACKTADGTIDGVGTVIGDSSATVAIDCGGHTYTGNEYLTVFDGVTGAEIDTVDYEPARGLISEWGDKNRGERYLAGVAYLGGTDSYNNEKNNPSILMCRGYYGRSGIAAYDLIDDKLVLRWKFDTNDDEIPSEYAAQGAHSLSIADVDYDGYDEIIYGSCAIDNDDTPLYSTKQGHGDALYVSDLSPFSSGMEVWMTHEDAPKDKGTGLYSAATGEYIWSYPLTYDIGRGCAADIDPAYPGAEMWCIADVEDIWVAGAQGYIFSCDGTQLYGSDYNKTSVTIPSANMSIWWDGDLGRELLDHANYSTSVNYGNGAIYKWNTVTNSQDMIFLAKGTATNNTTKNNPCLSADILGDWREEVIYRTEDNSALRIYTTTDITETKLYTLMHDSQYRLSVATENVGYNQPPQTSFYIGYDMDWNDVPIPNIITLPYIEEYESRLQTNSFDFGPARGTLTLGYIPVTEESIYSDSLSYGYIDGNASGDILDSSDSLNGDYLTLDLAFKILGKPGTHTITLNVLDDCNIMINSFSYSLTKGYNIIEDVYTADGFIILEATDSAKISSLTVYRHTDTSKLIDLINDTNEYMASLNQTMYTDSSLSLINNAVTAANTALNNSTITEKKVASLISDINDALSNLTYKPDAPVITSYAFDFGTTSSTVADGYTRFANNTCYSEDTYYGLRTGVDSRNRNTSDSLYADFLVGNNYDILIDLPVGKYVVWVMCGDYTDSNTSKITANNNIITTLSSASSQRAETTFVVNIEGTMSAIDSTLYGQLDLNISGSSARINAMTITPYEAPSTEDITALNNAITTANNKLDSIDTSRYLESSINRLKTTIDEASNILASEYPLSMQIISYTDSLNTQVANLQERPLAPIVTDYIFDFGNGSVADGNVKVSSTALYDEYTYYGLSTTLNSRTRTSDSDILTNDFVFGNDYTFTVDVPMGTYNISLTAGDYDNSNTSIITIQDEESITLTSVKNEYASYDTTVKVKASKTDVDGMPYGSISIHVTGSSARLNAVSITKAEENTDYISVLTDTVAATREGISSLRQDYYSETAWTLVTDTLSICDNMLANSSLYTREDFENADSDLKSAYNTLLKSYAYTVDFNFDFGTATSSVENGYTAVTGNTLYSDNVLDTSQHYGLISPTLDRDVSGGALFRDYVYGENGSSYTFLVDVPNGTYNVAVLTGDKKSANTTKLYFQDDDSIIYTHTSSSGSQYKIDGATPTYTVVVTDGSLRITLYDDTASTTISARLNALNISLVSIDNTMPDEPDEPDEPDNYIDQIIDKVTVIVSTIIDKIINIFSKWFH